MVEAPDMMVPEVPVKLGNKQYNIKCSFGVFRRFQKLIGPDKDVLNLDIYKDMSVDDYVKFFAACIYADKNDPPENHLDEVADDMGHIHIEQLALVVRELFGRSEPVPEKKAESPKPELEAKPESESK